MIISVTIIIIIIIIIMFIIVLLYVYYYYTISVIIIIMIISCSVTPGGVTPTIMFTSQSRTSQSLVYYSYFPDLVLRRILHTCHILPPFEIDLGLCLAVWLPAAWLLLPLLTPTS